MIKTIYKAEEVIDFAWELNQNNLYASYPRRNSIKALKDDIEKAINVYFSSLYYYYNFMLTT
jgi:hypothetical protein